MDDQGQPKEPVYQLGPVVRRGANFYDKILDNGEKLVLNHADFISSDGVFDICSFFDACKSLYPGIANVFLEN